VVLILQGCQRLDLPLADQETIGAYHSGASSGSPLVPQSEGKGCPCEHHTDKVNNSAKIQLLPKQKQGFGENKFQ